VPLSSLQAEHARQEQLLARKLAERHRAIDAAAASAAVVSSSPPQASCAPREQAAPHASLSTEPPRTRDSLARDAPPPEPALELPAAGAVAAKFEQKMQRLFDADCGRSVAQTPSLGGGGVEMGHGVSSSERSTPQTGTHTGGTRAHVRGSEVRAASVRHAGRCALGPRRTIFWACSPLRTPCLCGRSCNAYINIHTYI
jgi:hypothetical protein